MCFNRILLTFVLRTDRGGKGWKQGDESGASIVIQMRDNQGPVYVILEIQNLKIREGKGLASGFMASFVA